MGASTRDIKKFEDGTMGPSLSTGEDGEWKKNTTGVSVKNPTPKLNARKIDSNAKKIEKLMAMMKKGKAKNSKKGESDASKWIREEKNLKVGK
jgi:hypothetical protein